MLYKTHFLPALSTLLLGTLASTMPLAANAALMTFDNEADFNTAISGLSSTTINFDSAAPGTVIDTGTSFEGVRFDYDILGLPLTVNDRWGTTSSPNYLGVDNDAFYGGDEFTMSFSSAQSAIGLYIHTSTVTVLLDNDFTITTNTGLSIDFVANLDTPLNDGNAYFMGLYTDTPSDAFTSIVFSSISEYFSFNIDDITYASASTSPPTSVSEPSSLALLGIALAGLLRLRKATH